MKNHVKRTLTVPDLVSFTCDRCGKTVEKDNTFEFQEAVSIEFYGGYGSVWGDGTRVRVDLCQQCGHELFKEIACTDDKEFHFKPSAKNFEPPEG